MRGTGGAALPADEFRRSRDRFVVREEGRLKFTLLFLVLIAVEMTDLVFALDSIPAIFGVTTRFLYRLHLERLRDARPALALFCPGRRGEALVYLRVGLACVLVFIGAKMMIGGFYHIPTGTSLIVVGGILAVSIAASLLKTKRTSAVENEPPKGV